MDEFDQIFDSTPAGAAPSVGTPALDEFDSIFDATPATPSGLNAVSGEIGKGLTFGWFDEIQGAERGLQNMIASVFGRGNGQTFGQNYTNTVTDLRQRDAAYEEANPFSAIGLQLGGAALPALMSGGASLAGLGARGAVEAPGLAASAARVLGRNLYGTGLNGAPTAFQLMKMGGTGGALAGAGEANQGNRLLGAAVGAPVGAIAAPILGKAIEGGINAVGDFAANNNILPALLSERGSFSGKPAVPGKKLTPEEFVLAKNLRNTPIEDVIAGANEIEQTVAGDVPLFLPEALKSPKVQRNARFISNFDPSMEFSQRAIGARAEGAGERIKGLFGEFAPETDTTTAGVGLINASEKAVQQLRNARRDATSATYKALEGEAVPDEIAIGLMDDAVISDAIETIGKIPAYKKELANAPAESFRYLNLVKQELDDQVSSLRRLGKDNQARSVAESRQKVVDALDGLESYKEVNAKYREMSQPINALEGTKDERGLLEGVLGKDRIKAHEAPAELLKLTADQIRDAKTALGPEGEEALKKSARALLQDVMNKADKKNQPALLLLKNEELAGKFRAMLGDEDYDKLAKGLGLEKRMAEGRNLYDTGSRTATNLAEESQFEKDVGFWKKLANKDIFGAVSDFFDGQVPDEVAQGLARIYFDPKRGSEAIKNILPLLRKYQATRKVSGAAAKGVGIETGQTTAPPGPRPKKASNLNRLITRAVKGDEKKLSALAILGAGENMPATPDKVKEVEALIDADPIDSTIYEFESSRNPLAKNPDSTASGAFQLLSKTAKALGVSDVFDIEQNYNGYKKLRAENEKRFGGDPTLVYAAHYLGAPTLDKLLKTGLRDLNADQRAQVKYLNETLLPRFMEIYRTKTAVA